MEFSRSETWSYPQATRLLSVHGILQARILEWVAVPFSRGSSQPRDGTQVTRTTGSFFTSWGTRGIILFSSSKILEPGHAPPWFPSNQTRPALLLLQPLYDVTSSPPQEVGPASGFSREFGPRRVAGPRWEERRFPGPCKPARTPGSVSRWCGEALAESQDLDGSGPRERTARPGSGAPPPSLWGSFARLLGPFAVQTPTGPAVSSSSGSEHSACDTSHCPGVKVCVCAHPCVLVCLDFLQDLS